MELMLSDCNETGVKHAIYGDPLDDWPRQHVYHDKILTRRFLSVALHRTTQCFYYWERSGILPRRCGFTDRSNSTAYKAIDIGTTLLEQASRYYASKLQLRLSESAQVSHKLWVTMRYAIAAYHAGYWVGRFATGPYAEERIAERLERPSLIYRDGFDCADIMLSDNAQLTWEETMRLAVRPIDRIMFTAMDNIGLPASFHARILGLQWPM